jgi:hypothetical protein
LHNSMKDRSENMAKTENSHSTFLTHAWDAIFFFFWGVSGSHEDSLVLSFLLLFGVTEFWVPGSQCTWVTQWWSEMSEHTGRAWKGWHS